MTSVRATVLRVEDGQLWLRLEDRPAGCGRCDEPGGCRSTRLADIFKPHGDVLRIADSLGGRVGDQVIIRVREGTPLRAALLGYGLPVVLMVVMAGLMQRMAPFAAPDGNALTGLVGGLLIGMLAARRFMKGRWHQGLTVVPADAVLPDCGNRP